MSQLQQDNLFFDVQKDVCKILNDIPELSDINFFPANDKDLETEITTALRKQGVCGIVLVNEADFQGFVGGLDTAWQINDLVVQVIENPITNRSQQNLKYCGTAEDIGAKVSQVLGGVEYGHHQTFNLKKIEIGEDNNLLTSKVTFQCLVTTNLSSYVPPEHPEHRIPFASQEWVEEYVGDGKLTFTKDGQTIGQFTANQKTDISVEIPNGGIWGQITGNIEDQADLKNALDAKADSTDLEPYALSADVDSRLTAKADLTAIGDATVTISQDGVQKAQFTLNQKNNVTVNLEKGDEAAWGNITGEISAQTDLKQELDNRYTVIATWSE